MKGSASSVETCCLYIISVPRKHGPYRMSSFVVVVVVVAVVRGGIAETVVGGACPQIGAKSAIVIVSVFDDWVCTVWIIMCAGMQNSDCGRVGGGCLSRQYSNVALDKVSSFVFRCQCESIIMWCACSRCRCVVLDALDRGPAPSVLVTRPKGVRLRRGHVCHRSVRHYADNNTPHNHSPPAHHNQPTRVFDVLQVLRSPLSSGAGRPAAVTSTLRRQHYEPGAPDDGAFSRTSPDRRRIVSRRRLESQCCCCCCCLVTLSQAVRWGREPRSVLQNTFVIVVFVGCCC